MELSTWTPSMTSQLMCKNHYCLKDKNGDFIETTHREIFSRAVDAIFDNDSPDNIKTNLNDYQNAGLFSFNSPVYYNAGSNYPLFNACFVGDVEDSIDDPLGIMDMCKIFAQIFKGGAGIGINISKLRPRNSMTGVGFASGPISFMELFNMVGEVIRSGGHRRAAIMIIMNVNHYDIEEFIDSKIEFAKKQKPLTCMNISVGITDKFMEAVKYDKDWELLNSYTGEKKIIKAKYLWDKLINNSVNTADPGVFFLDSANKMNTCPFINNKRELICSTNPCLSGDQRIVTSQGLVKMKDWADSGKRLKVWSGIEWVLAGAIFTGEKEVFKITLSNGSNIKLTEEHIISSDEQSKKVKDCIIGDEIDWQEPTLFYEFEHDMDMIFAGFMQGDGTFHKASDRWKYINLGKKDNDVLSLFKTAFKNEIGDSSESKSHSYPISKKLADKIGDLLIPAPRKDRYISEEVMQLSPAKIVSFLRGLYSANGYPLENYNRITLKSVCRKEMLGVQELLSLFGIRSYITTNKSHSTVFANGEYTCRESYDLNITSSDIKLFQKYIGFIHEYKSSILQKIVMSMKQGRRFPITVKEISSEGIKPVYDFQMEHTHWASVSGFKIHNCGEIPLPAWSACNLASLILHRFYSDKKVDKESFEIGNGWFNLSLFKKAVKDVVTAMDKIIDVTMYPTPEFENTHKYHRALGLGFSGLGALLLKAGLGYGTRQARWFAALITQHMTQTAYEQSENLAKKNSACRAWKNQKNRIAFVNVLEEFKRKAADVYELPKETYEKWDTIINNIKINGVRNMFVTCIAPTGNTGYLMDSITSGCEPEFGFVYAREGDNKVKFTNINSLLQVELKENKDYQKVIDYAIEHNGSLQGCSYLTKEQQEIWVCAQDLSAEQHIKMQAACSNFVSLGVSKTINLPKSTTNKIVSDTYKLAWEMGCKGTTVYVEGSNPDAPIRKVKKSKESKTEFIPNSIRRLPRTKIVSSKSIEMATPDGSLFITIGYSDISTDVIEVFVHPGKGSNSAVNGYAEAVGRIISLACQSGVPIKEIAHQLIGIPGQNPVLDKLSDENERPIKIYSGPDAIGKVLLSHIEPKTLISGEICPVCKFPSIIYENSCKTCKNPDCGYTACGG